MLINVDCGEELMGYPVNHDDDIIPHCDLINIACGGHAGSTKTISHCVEVARHHKTLVGAHPSFSDKKNFGRIVVDISFQDLVKDIYNQIKLVNDICKEIGIKLHHVKPHGALYNIACKDEEYAMAVIKSIKKLNDHKLKLLAPRNSMLALLAENEFIPVLSEVFVDRKYSDSGELVSRNKTGSVLEDKEEIYAQFQNLKDGFVLSENNIKIYMDGDTACVHGEHRHIMEILLMLNNSK
jgi:UPF0271 protein